MKELSCVLFNVYAFNSYSLDLCAHHNIKISIVAKRNIRLRNLIRLRKVWIEIVLSVLLAYAVYSAVKRMSHLYSVLNNLFVERRQSARHTHAYRTNLRIYLKSKGIFAAAIYFCSCIQLSMNLKTYYDLIASYSFISHTITLSCRQSFGDLNPPKASSWAYAVLRIVLSSNLLPIICMP